MNTSPEGALPAGRRRWASAVLSAAIATAGFAVLVWLLNGPVAEDVEVHTSAAETARRLTAAAPKPTPQPATIAVSAARLERGRRDLEAAIAWSAEMQDYAIVVDKSAYTLQVYKDGTLINSWPVELGPDPANDKARQGDLCTPEGRYRVTWRREIGQTSFYKALLIDYPNGEDRRLGRTGSHIEIHGMGSGRRPGNGGHNWTLGCVALSNSHIDTLFALVDGSKRVTEETPVTIIFAGSLGDEAYELISDPD